MKKSNSNTNRNSNTNTAARVERWQGHIVKHLAAYAAHGADIPAAWFEEIEGRAMADVLTDSICKQRGIGVTNRTPEQQMNFELDENYERAATRTRNAHESDVAYMEVMAHLHNDTRLPIDDTMHALVRKFYRAGDCGIDAAIVRAVQYAVTAHA